MVEMIPKNVRYWAGIDRMPMAAIRARSHHFGHSEPMAAFRSQREDLKRPKLGRLVDNRILGA